MRFALMLSLAALTGCASVYSYPLDTTDARSRQRVTERAADKDVVVWVRGESRTPAADLSVRADSTSWTDPATGEMRTVATAQLRSVTFPGRERQPLKAFAIGLGTGAVVGGALGYLSYEFPNWWIDSRGDAAALGAGAGGLAGMLSAGLVDQQRSHTNVYRASGLPAAPSPVAVTAPVPTSPASADAPNE